MHVAHFCTRQMFWRKLTMQILKGGILCRSRARARVDKVAPLPVAFLPRIVLIKKRGTPVMKNPSFRRIVRNRISRFSIVRLWHRPPLAILCSQYILTILWTRVCFRARNKEAPIEILHFNSLSNIAIRYTTMLQYQSCFSSSRRWFFFGTRNKGIRVLVFAASVLLLIFRNCRPIVLGHKRSGPGGICAVLHGHLMDSFVELGVLFNGINKASRERAGISCGGRY